MVRWFGTYLLVAIGMLGGPVLGAEHDPPAARPADGWRSAVKPGPFQSEIDKLSPGETLRLKPGVYQGPIRIKTPNVTLDGGQGATLNGGGQGSVILIEADGVAIRNLRITGSGRSHSNVDSGIAIRESSGVRLENNSIDDCLFGIDVAGGRDIGVKGNAISSQNLPLGLRGDAIRLWAVKDSRLVNNTWTHSRDVVAWYCERILVEGNEGSKSRYSLHSMYSKELVVRNNRFIGNSVGVFLMYGSGATLIGNTIQHALGATGIGIGMKEASGVFVQDNNILYCATGLLVDNSPLAPGTRNWFNSNRIVFNGKGVVISNDREGNEFRKNTFTGNIDDASSENRAGSRGLWRANVWDKYDGFDRDGNGIGDTPYVVRKFGERLTDGTPFASFFYGTPVLSLVSLIERLLPISEPLQVLRDEEPGIRVREGVR